MSMTDFNAKVISEFRANGGQVASMDAMPLLLLHHVGAKSGQTRVQPLAYLEDGGRYVIYASKAGADTNPGWYHNLKAHPDVSIEIGDRTIEVRAEEATGAERDRLFQVQAETQPQFAGYAEKTSRVIPVVVLVPKD
jgi:deazaflavin-dependent oxidoreductase (nitroreductase family)